MMFATLHIKPGQTPRLIIAWEQEAAEKLLGVPTLEFQAVPGEEVIGGLRSRRAVERVLRKRGLTDYTEFRVSRHVVRA